MFKEVPIKQIILIHYENNVGGKRNGFFIESGAYDGETISNSLFFELKRNYTGKFHYMNKQYGIQT